MIAHDVIISFSIFVLLTYGRIFGKTLKHDNHGLQ